jgi:DNA-binding NarL/FixJ family response regulator
MLEIMKPFRNNPAINVNMNVRKFRNEIILDIHLDESKLLSLFKNMKEPPLIKVRTTDNPVNVSIVELDNDEYLTIREVEIMDRLAKGWLNKEIADDLKCSINTVRNHLHSIFHKLKVSNRIEAIVAYQFFWDLKLKHM